MSAAAEGTRKKNATASSQLEPPPWESPQWREAVSQNPALAPFFDNLESFVELPKGVEKLRDLFLNLAVRGHLVDQDNSEYCLLYTSPSPRDQRGSRMPSSA